MSVQCSVTRQALLITTILSNLDRCQLRTSVAFGPEPIMRIRCVIEDAVNFAMKLNVFASYKSTIITSMFRKKRYWQIGDLLDTGFGYSVFKLYFNHKRVLPFHLKGRSFGCLKQKRYDESSRLFGFQVYSG